MLKKFGIALFAVLLVSFVVASRGAAQVTNGGFETGNFSGWTVTDASSGSLLAVNNADPHTGTYAASFGATRGLDDSISQTLATVAGQSYTFSFWLAHVNPTSTVSNDFSASWGGTTLLNLVNSTAPFVYTNYTFTETAPTSSTVITFSGRETPAYFYLDDVSVTGPVPTVPEPVSLFLFGAGLVGMAVIKRKNGKEEV